jgi:hypothetical protein
MFDGKRGSQGRGDHITHVVADDNRYQETPRPGQQAVYQAVLRVTFLPETNQTPSPQGKKSCF